MSNIGSVEWFDEKRLLILRRTRAAHDFLDALVVTRRLLEVWDPASLDRPEQTALFQKAVLTYARPFTPNRTRQGGKATFPVGAVKGGPGFDMAIHRHLMDLRDKLIAHADEAVHPPTLNIAAMVVRHGGEERTVPFSISACSHSLATTTDRNFVAQIADHLEGCIVQVHEKIQAELPIFLAASQDNFEEYQKSGEKAEKTLKHMSSGSVETGETRSLLSMGELLDAFKTRPEISIDKDHYVYPMHTVSFSFDKVEVKFRDGRTITIEPSSAGPPTSLDHQTDDD